MIYSPTQVILSKCLLNRGKKLVIAALIAYIVFVIIIIIILISKA